ncbi:MAG: SRPBCC family protein [Anaerolineaceae bacterium]|nr:SRPBCC family protein [Anaerolineaceae bacterium]MCB9100719.1 SRPBCC family protein [Anaerolineales bacterium]
MPKFERQVEIEAPVETVWAVITNPQQWPFWFPGIEAVSNVSEVKPGGTFQWQDEGRTGVGTIVSLEPNERLEVMTQMGDDKDAHLFELKPDRGFLGLGGSHGCRLDYTLDTLMGGGILAQFLAGGNPKDTLRVKKALNSLKDLVEGHGR